MNIVSYAFRGPSYFDISLPENQTSLDWWVGVLGEIFADQKFMALFSLLFGASVLLFLERAELKTDRPVKLSLFRNFLLLLIGLIHVSIWEGDILTVYALCAPLLLALRGFPSCADRLNVIYMVSALSNYFMASLGTDEVLREVWAGNLPTQLHETIGLIFLTDAFTRASGMMLIGMGLYKTGYLKDPSRALAQRKHAMGAILVGVLASTLGLLWSHHHQYNATSIVVGNIANTLHDTMSPATSFCSFIGTIWNQSITRTPTPTRSERLTNYLTDSRMLYFVSSLPKENSSRTLLLSAVLVVRFSKPPPNMCWPGFVSASRAAMALCHLSTA